MAGSFVQVTSGAGPKLATSATYTENANVVQDPKMIVGEQYVPSYTATAIVSIATNTSHVMQLMAGASLKVRVRRIEIYQWVIATTAAIWTPQLYRLTTAGSGGTAITPSALDPSDAASGATAMTLPSTKGTLGVNIANATQFATQTVATAGGGAAPIIYDFDGPRRKPLIIAAGTSNGIALVSSPAMANAQVMVNIYFDETSW